MHFLCHLEKVIGLQTICKYNYIYVHYFSTYTANSSENASDQGCGPGECSDNSVSINTITSGETHVHACCTWVLQSVIVSSGYHWVHALVASVYICVYLLLTHAGLSFLHVHHMYHVEVNSMSTVSSICCCSS